MRANCSICSDFFDGLNVVALSCGHVFHENCLSQWRNHGQTCPDCRKRIVGSKSVIKLFFNLTTMDNSSVDHLANEVSDLQTKLTEKDMAMAQLQKNIEELREFVVIAEKNTSDKQLEVCNLKADALSTRTVIKNLRKTAAKVTELETMNRSLVNKLEMLQNVQTVISGTQKDIEDILESTSKGPEGLNNLASYCSLLKRELLNSCDCKKKLQNEIYSLTRGNSLQKLNIKKLTDETKQLQEQILSLEKENCVLSERLKSSQPEKSMSKSSATISYESPVPERLKNSSDNEIIPVTPLSERPKFHIGGKRKILSVTYENSNTVPRIIKKPLLDSDVKLIYDSRQALNKKNENSIIREGYNGLGGHDKFITSSKSVYVMRPLKRNK